MKLYIRWSNWCKVVCSASRYSARAEAAAVGLLKVRYRWGKGTGTLAHPWMLFVVRARKMKAVRQAEETDNVGWDWVLILGSIHTYKNHFWKSFRLAFLYLPEEVQKTQRDSHFFYKLCHLCAPIKHTKNIDLFFQWFCRMPPYIPARCGRLWNTAATLFISSSPRCSSYYLTANDYVFSQWCFLESNYISYWLMKLWGQFVVRGVDEQKK